MASGIESQDQINNKDELDQRKKILPAVTASAMAATFKALADPTRLRLLSILFHGECCVNELADALEMSQSAVSHQLRILRNLKFVSNRRDGHLIFYCIDDDHISDLFQRSLEHSEHLG